MRCCQALSTSCDMHLRSLMLLRLTVKEMRLQKTVFGLGLGVKVTQDVAKYPLHHVTYAHANFEVVGRRCIYKKLHSLTFGVKVTQNIAQYLLHHVIYVQA